MSQLFACEIVLDFNFTLEEQKIEGKKYLEDIYKSFFEKVYDTKIKIDSHYEDGSIKYFIKIIAPLYIAIGMYGSFRSGIDYIIEDSNRVNKVVISTLQRKGLSQNRILSIKRTRSLPNKIKYLFTRVDRLEKNRSKMNDVEVSHEILLIKNYITGIINCTNSIDDKEFILSGFYNSESELLKKIIGYREPAILRKRDEEDYFLFPFHEEKDSNSKSQLKLGNAANYPNISNNTTIKNSYICKNTIKNNMLIEDKTKKNR